MMKVPADKHPIETIIIADKNRLVLYYCFYPIREPFHNFFRIIKEQSFFP
jgi:hypothetical protein